MALLAGFIPAVNASAATPLAKADIVTTVTDPGTADSWEGMMGTSVDGNRYAGRVWVDKSVYKDGDTAVLNSNGAATDGTNNYETNWVSNYTEEVEDPDDPENPQTGDYSKLHLWTALLIISGGGILVLAFCDKKKRTAER